MIEIEINSTFEKFNYIMKFVCKASIFPNNNNLVHANLTNPGLNRPPINVL